MKITNQNPQSKKITTYAKKISTATVTCTTDEKALMKAEVTSMESAIASVSTVLTAIQEQIESKTEQPGLTLPRSHHSYSSSDRVHGLLQPAGHHRQQ